MQASSEALAALRELEGCQALRALLEAGAGALAVDAPLGRRRRTLLHFAVLGCLPELAERLLDLGADPLIEDACGLSPLSLAVGLREALQAGGAIAGGGPVLERLDAMVSQLEFAAAAQYMWEDMPVPQGGAGPPPPPAPLSRLVSTSREAASTPPPKPPALERSITVEGATTEAAGADLGRALAVASCRPDGNVQLTTDIGLWCVLLLQGDAMPPELRPESAGAGRARQLRASRRCGICFEVKTDGLVTGPCGMGSCSGAFCTECLAEHTRQSVGEMRYAVPVVRCPECRRRIPTRAWAPLLAAGGAHPAEESVAASAEPVQQRIELAGQALLKIRCRGCDKPRDLFRFHPAESKRGDTAFNSFAEAMSHKAKRALKDYTPRQRLRIAKELEMFRRGGPADPVLNALVDVWAGQVRTASDGTPSPPPRVAPPELATRFWDVCGLLRDPERSVALQLAFYRRFPHISTPCCKTKMCFTCKVHGHHEGVSCAEKQAAELAIEAQCCPSCGVPTVKSEGCNHIICPCGTSWQWRG